MGQPPPPHPKPQLCTFHGAAPQPHTRTLRGAAPSPQPPLCPHNPISTLGAPAPPPTPGPRVTPPWGRAQVPAVGRPLSPHGVARGLPHFCLTAMGGLSLSIRGGVGRGGPPPHAPWMEGLSPTCGVSPSPSQCLPINESSGPSGAAVCAVGVRLGVPEGPMEWSPRSPGRGPPRIPWSGPQDPNGEVPQGSHGEVPECPYGAEPKNPMEWTSSVPMKRSPSVPVEWSSSVPME